MGAKSGDKVKIHYTGSLDDGDVFDTSEGRDPLEFELGGKQVIPGFESAVEGMEVDEEKEVKIEPKDAYGDYNDQLVRTLPKDNFKDIDVKEDMVVGMRAEGVPHEIPAKVTKVTDKDVTIDFNPPLAGKTLNFKIKLVSIN